MNGPALVLTSLVFGYTCRVVQVVNKDFKQLDVASGCDVAF